MYIRILDKDVMDIYVKQYLIKNIDFSIKENLEKYLKDLFKILKNKYNIIVEGFYEIIIYIDKYYGIVLNLKKDELEYYNYYKNQVDMSIITNNTDFFYLVDDIPNDLLNKISILYEKNNIYIKLKEQLTDVQMMKLLESSKIVYNI